MQSHAGQVSDKESISLAVGRMTSNIRIFEDPENGRGTKSQESSKTKEFSLGRNKSYFGRTFSKGPGLGLTAQNP